MTQPTQWEMIFQNDPHLFAEPSPRVVSFAEQLLDHNLSSVLDIGCGPGRHVLHMTQKGLRVTGLDNTPTALIHFLASHGWVADAPIAFPARVSAEAYRAFVDGEVVPIHRADVLRAAGVEFAGAVEPETPCVLVELESPEAAPVHLVGLQNFYALTRYNRSSFYAAAVNDLAEEIKAAYRSR